jgi:hypothetical protein
MDRKILPGQSTMDVTKAHAQPAKPNGFTCHALSCQKYRITTLLSFLFPFPALSEKLFSMGASTFPTIA